jgi:hypothetical protein
MKNIFKNIKWISRLRNNKFYLNWLLPTSKFLIKFQKIIYIGLVLFIWIFTAIGFTNSRAKTWAYTVDMWGHVEYTRYIQDHLSFPSPYYGWETYQPPLFYVINYTFFHPESVNHIKIVDYSCLAYGTVFILTLFWLLSQYGIKDLTQFLVVLAISSTPNFFIIFTEYNNDGLFLMLAGIIICLSKQNLLNSPKNRFFSLGLITFLMIATLYVKYTAMLFFISYLIYLLYLRIKKIVSSKTVFLYLGMIGITIIAFSPWIYFHNFKDTGKLLPTNFDKNVSKPIPSNLKSFTYSFPFLNNGELIQPFSNHINLISNEFVEMIYGEWWLGNDNTIQLAWLIYWLTLILTISILLKNIFLKIVKENIVLILLGFISVISYYLVSPDFTSLNVRYIYWVLLPISLILAFSIDEMPKNKLINKNYFYTTYVLLIGLIGTHLLFIYDLINILKANHA